MGSDPGRSGALPPARGEFRLARIRSEGQADFVRQSRSHVRPACANIFFERERFARRSTCAGWRVFSHVRPILRTMPACTNGLSFPRETGLRGGAPVRGIACFCARTPFSTPDLPARKVRRRSWEARVPEAGGFSDDSRQRRRGDLRRLSRRQERAPAARPTSSFPAESSSPCRARLQTAPAGRDDGD